MKNYYQPDCPVFLNFLTHNTETPPSVLKAAIKNMLTGQGGQGKVLELRGPYDTGKDMFLDLLIALAGENNSIRISVQDKVIPKFLETQNYRLIIIDESIRKFYKGELRNLEALISNHKLKGLVVKITETDSVPKPFLTELATTVNFKRNGEKNYQASLINAIANELEAIRCWALED